MSELTSADIDHLAKLARISLTEEEKAKLSEQLPRIVEFFGQIQQVEGLSTETDEQGLVALDSLRPDEPSSGPDGLSIDQLKQLAPEFNYDQIVVPAVFGDGGDA